MEIIFRHNSVYLKNASLGKGFADIIADLIVDTHGRVKVVSSKLSFYTDLNHLPFEILDAISEGLEKETDNRILERIKEKIQRTKAIGSANHE